MKNLKQNKPRGEGRRSAAVAPHRRGAGRGRAFQELLNRINEAYASGGRAYIVRKGVPGKYVTGRRTPNQPPAPRFIPESRAEPDYGGVMAPTGRGVFYDAKTTRRDRIDFDNLHPHQIDFLARMAACGATAGFLVEFAARGDVFFVPVQLVTRWKTKSIPYAFCAAHLTPVPRGRGLIVYDYLTAVETQERRYGADYAELPPPDNGRRKNLTEVKNK